MTSRHINAHWKQAVRHQAPRIKNENVDTHATTHNRDISQAFFALTRVPFMQHRKFEQEIEDTVLK
jgi:hypothetical protein